MLAAVATASVLWGAAAAWTAGEHASAAGDVVTASEPLSFDAQQIYQSLSDADATEAAAFLAGLEPPAARQRYLADVARAASYLEAATAAAGGQGQAHRLTVLSTELPVYTGLVESARADNRLGLPVGAAYLAEASELMRSRLLPAPRPLPAGECPAPRGLRAGHRAARARRHRGADRGRGTGRGAARAGPADPGGAEPRPGHRDGGRAHLAGLAARGP